MRTKKQLAQEFQHRYDDETDTFVIVVKAGTYILAPTGKHLKLPEDKPHKNTVLYRCCFYDAAVSDKEPLHIGTGREAWIMSHAIGHHVYQGKYEIGRIQQSE